MKYVLLTFVAMFITMASISAETFTRNIHWQQAISIPTFDEGDEMVLKFTGGINTPESNYLPKFLENFPLSANTSSIEAKLINMVFETVPEDEITILYKRYIPTNIIDIETAIGYQRKMPFAIVSFIPIRINELTGKPERLIRFDLEITESASGNSPAYKSKSYKSSSVLATGNWYKIKVSEDGVYRINTQQLSNMGINPATIDPRNIRVYGNGAGMLSENIEDFRYDDLEENRIYLKGEEDGSFDSGDYILFYGQSPNTWYYDEEDYLLKKKMHLYDDYTYYFLTTDLGPGKRIIMEEPTTATPTNFIGTFHDAIHYEVEENNLIGTGRIWYGEEFDLTLNINKSFSIPDFLSSGKVTLEAEAAARSDATSYFRFDINGNEQLKLFIDNINSNNPNGNYARAKNDTARFYLNSGEIGIDITYSKPYTSSIGWLDFFTLNFQRSMTMSGPQLIFRNLQTNPQPMVSEYTLAKANNSTRIWNITNPVAVHEMPALLNNTQLKFINDSDGLETFIAFNDENYLEPKFVEKIENQDLHGTGNFDMIILVHKNFRSEADRLSEFHTNFSGLDVFVVEPEIIYNEFSSGSQDITAIRDFLKMLYDNASEGDEPRYLLLFGDGSYDYKNRLEDNTNFIPVWESYQSLNPISSYVNDGFFCLLDGSNDYFVDMGVGRFVVSNQTQAKLAVDKTIHYASNSEDVMGDWRNIITLIADDEDSNLHLNDAEDLAAIIDTMDRNINVEKIYLDAYQQLSTPSGERYPEVTDDINRRVNRGALMINYVGHGGEGGLAHERIMKISDIQGWDNWDNMPVFITATCEFSRFDDPERVSAGELIFLNPNGGGVALFTTTRATYAGANAIFDQNFYRYALQITEGEHLTMGDVIRFAKNATGSLENTSKFTLLGDPALKMAFPKHRSITASVNNISITESVDTINALSEVKVSGIIEDYQGNHLTNFNGTLFPSVFDKPLEISSLGNDPGSSPVEFTIQKSILYKGKASITNGEWEFSFIAPKDIAYQYGFGKISYYAHNNDNIDAAGAFDDIIIGGYNANASVDNQGPMIDLFINDINFANGGITDENPVLLAHIFDENGINTVGSGIGHDIQGTLNGLETFVMNEFYEAELDDFKRGSINYPFFDLDNGNHKLSLRVWDIYNNSSTATIEFIVADSEEIVLNSLLNYPNPFKNSTVFSFEHNQISDPLDITLYIYSLDGGLVKVLNDVYYAGGYKYKSASWDGSDLEGNKLGHGIYIYKIKVKNQDGSHIEETNKLVILK